MKHFQCFFGRHSIYEWLIKQLSTVSMNHQLIWIVNCVYLFLLHSFVCGFLNFMLNQYPSSYQNKIRYCNCRFWELLNTIISVIKITSHELIKFIKNIINLFCWPVILLHYKFTFASVVLKHELYLSMFAKKGCDWLVSPDTNVDNGSVSESNYGNFNFLPKFLVFHS